MKAPPNFWSSLKVGSSIIKSFRKPPVAIFMGFRKLLELLWRNLRKNCQPRLSETRFFLNSSGFRKRSELNRRRTYQIPSLSGAELIRYRAYQAPNLSGIFLIRRRSYETLYLQNYQTPYLSVSRSSTCKSPNLSDAKLIRCQNCQIPTCYIPNLSVELFKELNRYLPNLRDTELFRYRKSSDTKLIAYQVPNLSEIKLIRYRHYKILKWSETELIRQ